MLRATLKSLLARKVRLLLSGLAIVLGVAFTAGAFVLTDSIGKTFDDLFGELNAKTDAVVRAQSDLGDGASALRDGLPAGLLDQLRDTPGVSAAEGSVSGYAQLVKKNGKAYNTNGAPTLGVNWDDEPELSGLVLRSGAAPTQAGQVAIDATTAGNSGYRVGDKVQVVLAGGEQQFTVSGVFGVGDNDGFAGASVLAFDTSTAQQLVGRPGQFSSIVFAADEGTSQQQLVQNLQAELPQGVEAITGKQNADETNEAFDQILTIVNAVFLTFAGIALFVGAFLIFNTFSILVAQRSRELALLRALGASRRQVNRSVLIEAVVVGFVGSLVGLGCGIGLAAGLKAIAGDNIPEGSLVIEPRTVIVSIVLGVLITVVAAIMPARRASRIAPIAAMRDAETVDAPLRRRTIIGLAFLAAGIAGVALGLSSSRAWLTLGGIGLFVGVIALSPMVARPVVRVLGAPLARRAPGKLGQLNAMRNPRRTSATAVALMIGLALVTGVSVLGASLKQSFSAVIESSLTASVIVQQSGGFSGIPENVAPDVEKLPEVGDTDVLRQEQAIVDGSDHFVTAVTTGALGRSFTVEQAAGDVSKLGPGTFVMDKDSAKSAGLSPGDRVPVQFARGGPQQLTLVGTYEPNELAGGYLFDLSVADDFDSQLVSALLLNPAPGISPAQLQQAVDGVLQPFPTVEAVSKDEFTDQIAGQVDFLINFVSILLALSVIIAVLGIINTLALAVFERTRELGLLRAVGLGRRQTRSMIRVEAVLVAVFGAVLGVVLGTVLGVVAQQALKDDGVGEFAFPYVRVVVFVVLAALAGVIAALLPARRAARLDVLRAISST